MRIFTRSVEHITDIFPLWQKKHWTLLRLPLSWRQTRASLNQQVGKMATTRRQLGPTLLQQQRRRIPRSRRPQVRSLSLTLRQCHTVRNPLQLPNVLSHFSFSFFCFLFCAECVGLLRSSFSSLTCSAFCAGSTYNQITVGAVWWHDKPNDIFIHSLTSTTSLPGFWISYVVCHVVTVSSQPIRTPSPV